MGYSDTIGDILYLKPDHHFVIHISHHVWFDEYNSRLYIEYKRTTGSLLLRQDPEGHIHESDIINLIMNDIYLTFNIFSDTTIIPYAI